MQLIPDIILRWYHRRQMRRAMRKGNPRKVVYHSMCLVAHSPDILTEMSDDMKWSIGLYHKDLKKLELMQRMLNAVIEDKQKILKQQKKSTKSKKKVKKK